MNTRSSISTAFLVFVTALAWLAPGGDAFAAGKKKRYLSPQDMPTGPVPSDAELGFVDFKRDDFLVGIKRLGVTTPIVPQWMDDRADAKQMVLDAVSKYLRLAHRDVVGPESYQAAFDRFNREQGGMYNARTGELEERAADAAYTRAVTEFVTKEHLDGFVTAIVRQTPATLSSLFATWDGVHDRSDGARVTWSTSGLPVEYPGGHIPALSLTLRIANAEGRMIYERTGGIQLTSYCTFNTFVEVAKADLMRDSARMERAAAVATVPLRFNPRQVWLGGTDPAINAKRIDLRDFPPLPPAKEKLVESGLRVPRAQILESVHRVALSPLDDMGDYGVPPEVARRFVDLVRKEVEPLGWQIVESPKVGAELRAQLSRTDLFDPLTGKRDDARVKELRAAAFRNLDQANPFDAVLEINIVRVVAVHDGGDVRWDGADQSAVTLGPIVDSGRGNTSDSLLGLGAIDALSLEAHMVALDDTPLFAGRGGVHLLKRLDAPTKADRVRVNILYVTKANALGPDEVFRDPAREQRAVHLALRELVLTPEALALELAPPAAKKAAR